MQVANDADLGALAEHHRGVGVGVDDLVYISGSIGVGAGVIVGGNQLTGAAGYSGEIGHISFNPRGRQCHCGNRGCWETEIGAFTIAAAIGCPVDQVASLSEILEGYQGSTDQLLNVGSELGRGLAGIVNTFNPRMVVLGGYLRSLFPLVHGQVEATLTELALPGPLESLTLAMPGLGRATRCCTAPPRWRSATCSRTRRGPRQGPARRVVPPGGLTGSDRLQPARVTSPAKTASSACSAAPVAAASGTDRTQPQLRAALHPGRQPLVEGARGRARHVVAERDEVATEHDHLRVEHVGQEGQAGARGRCRAARARRGRFGSCAAASATASADRTGVSSSGIPTRASIACRPTCASQQPRLPQPQRAAESPTGMWPTSPAKPSRPRSRWPSAMMPAPMPTVPVR